MSKRSILISVAVIVNVVIIAAVVWHRRTHPAMVLNTQLAAAGIDFARLVEFGLAGGITPQEVQDATNILVRERLMWSKLNSMSAGISVDFDGSDGKQLSLKGNVLLRRVGLSPTERAKFLAKYEMTISDKWGGWTVKTDGTPTNTVITCQDPQMLGVIKTIDPATILHLLTFPQYYLGARYRDELYPRDLVNPYTLNEMLRIWEPLLMTNATPHSYAFFYSHNDGEGGYLDYTFRNGHLDRWRKTKANPGNPVVEKLAIYFENPVQSDGFWYPTVIRMCRPPLLGLFHVWRRGLLS